MADVSTVFIPAAGTGSRLRPLTDHFPKALVAIGRRPAISYVIDLYPKGARFIVATGHMGDMVREYLASAYPGHDLTVVEVSCFEGPAAGLGRTIAESAHLLDSPFVFHAVDSVLFEPWWVDLPAGVDALVVADPPRFAGRYRHARLDPRGGCLAVSEPADNAPPGLLPYIGVSFIAHPDRFAEWAGATTGEVGEVEYLRRVIPAGVSSVHVQRWYDVGSPEGLAVARADINTGGDAVNTKLTDVTFFTAGTVTKVHASPGIAAAKRDRGRALGAAVPAGIEAGRYCLNYRKVAGTPVSERSDPARLLPPLLTWLRAEFWPAPALDGAAAAQFRAAGDRFYRQDTMSRIDALPEQLRQCRVTDVDGVAVDASLATVAAALPWSEVQDGVPVRWHGDLHPNNVLVTDDGGFVLIDWRADFGTMPPPWGDLYYELAKLRHGYLLPDAVIDSGRFSVSTTASGGSVSVATDHPSSGEDLRCLEILREAVEEWNLDWNRVILVSGLVFLRMSPLYPQPRTTRLLWATGLREVATAYAASGGW